MRRRYFASGATVRNALRDAAIAAFSVILAIAIRASFQDFFVRVTEIALLGPFIVLTRAGTMVFFEHYSYHQTVWQPRDVVSLFLHNLAPTILLLFLRFLAPVQYLRFPVSVIVLEYMFSVSLMIFARATALSSRTKGGTAPRYRPRVVLYGEIQDIRRSMIVKKLVDAQLCRVVAILSPNPMHWDTDVEGIRVLGDEDALEQLLQVDDSVSKIILVADSHIPRARIENICRRSEQLGMKVVTETDAPLSS